MDATDLDSILILLGVAVAGVALFRVLRLPQILAYLCAGVIVGPRGMGWVAESAEIRALAEFGLVFLLFTIGLEFLLPRLIALRGMVLGLGGAQVLIGTAVFGAIAWALGVTVESAIALGGMLALSLTAIACYAGSSTARPHLRNGDHAPMPSGCIP
jgi:CPA2 family monovalent cation:H+ antiporter-2